MSNSYKVYASKDYVDSKIVQPDWNQSDPTAADYVKGRTHYKGSEIVEEVLFDGYVIISGGWNDDVGMPVGFGVRMDAQYIVMFDGTEYVLEPIMDDGGTPYIGAADIWYDDWSSEATYNVPFAYGDGWFGAIEDGRHTVTIIQKAQAIHTLNPLYLPNIPAEKLPYIPVNKLPYIPEDLLPPITEDMLPTIPEEKLPEKIPVTYTQGVYSGDYDGTTDGRDTFVFNAFNYYKISDFAPLPDEVSAFTGTRANGNTYSMITQGENACQYGLFIVVNTAGLCKIKVNTTIIGFNAPSTGLYASNMSGNSNTTAGSYSFTYKTKTICAVNPNTMKKYAIIVDDSGELKAIEAAD